MLDPNINPIRPNKLFHSKWTAVSPVNKEKHFLVIKLCQPPEPDAPVTLVELQAVHSGRIQQIAWRELQDKSHWRQGWL